MYMTFLAASPWAKTLSFFANLASFLPSPAESRKSFTSNGGRLVFAIRRECGGALTERRLTAEEAIGQSTCDPIPLTVQYCTASCIRGFYDAGSNCERL